MIGIRAVIVCIKNKYKKEKNKDRDKNNEISINTIHSSVQKDISPDLVKCAERRR